MICLVREVPAPLDRRASEVGTTMRREQLNEMLIYTIARQLVILSAWDERYSSGESSESV